jgi:predicted DsbA family dithiol-disulfide isomerase
MMPRSSLVGVQVEIWADIACPWCYVGKRRFEQALDRFDGRDGVSVVWRAFQLDPGAPPERPGTAAAHIARKYGTTEGEAQARQAQIAALGAADGLDLRFDRVRTGNTYDAHRVVRLGAEHGRQDEVLERLFRAYFTDGALLSDHETLRGLAADLPGIDELLTGDRFADSVGADQELAAAIGIRGVPFYAVDRRIGASGAQDPAVLLDMLEEIRRRAAA